MFIGSRPSFLHLIPFLMLWCLTWFDMSAFTQWHFMTYFRMPKGIIQDRSTNMSEHCMLGFDWEIFQSYDLLGLPHPLRRFIVESSIINIYGFGWYNLEMDAWINHETDAWINHEPIQLNYMWLFIMSRAYWKFARYLIFYRFSGALLNLVD